MMKNFMCITLLVLSVQALAGNEQEDNSFLAGFITGEYHLIGKAPDTGEAYTGEISFDFRNEKIDIVRIIEGRSVPAVGTIESVTPDQIEVLKIHFTQDDVKYEETCLIDADLDNYARITCHLYRPGAKTSKPGFEAFFIKYGEE